MSLSSLNEYNSNGGGFGGGWGGGWGNGIGGVGLIGLIGLLGRDGLGGHSHRGGDDGDNGCGRNLAILAAIAGAKDTTVAEARALSNAVCDAEKTNLQQFYAQAIQTSNATNELKAQAVAFAVQNDSKLDAISRQISIDGDLTRALINQNTIQDLRDQLNRSHRHADGREIEITIQNSNAQAQAQVQAQFAAQNDWLKNRFFEFDNQINNTKQGIVNLGTMVASGTQSTQATNIGK